jgi:hypothetical protein
LPSLEREAVLKSATEFFQEKRIGRIYDRCAAERGGAVRRSDKPPRHRVLY